MSDSLPPNREYQRRRQWQPTPVLLPGKSHGWRSLVGYSPWGREESDTTEQLHFHFSLSCIGEGNGNPLQCSCLENLRDRGAWWAAVSGVAQSWTRLKQLSSSSSSSSTIWNALSHLLQQTKISFFISPTRLSAKLLTSLLGTKGKTDPKKADRTQVPILPLTFIH